MSDELPFFPRFECELIEADQAQSPRYVSRLVQGKRLLSLKPTYDPIQIE